jgi:hypothetical protein
VTRAEYVQVRATMRLIDQLVQELPLGNVLAAIGEAERAGPLQNPKMWAEGREQLEADRALAMALAKLQTFLPGRTERRP